MITADEFKNKIGLSDKEARVYFAILKTGSGYASALAASAGIKRSTAYQVLEKLHECGLVLKYRKGKKFFYAPSKPCSILEYLDSKEKTIVNQKAQFREMLPELNVYFAQKQKKPQLIFFEKKQEVYNLFFDMFKSRGNEEVIGFISLDALFDDIDTSFFKKMAKTINQNSMAVKLLNYDDAHDAEKNTRMWLTKYFHKLPSKLQPQVKVVPEKKQMDSSIFIAAHKTYLIDLNPPEFMGTVISNNDLAQGFSVMFYNMWKKS